MFSRKKRPVLIFRDTGDLGGNYPLALLVLQYSYGAYGAYGARVVGSQYGEYRVGTLQNYGAIRYAMLSRQITEIKSLWFSSSSFLLLPFACFENE